MAAEQRKTGASDPDVDQEIGLTVFEPTTPVARVPSMPTVHTTAAVVAPAAFGRYQVKRALGTGGFGAVFLGHDLQLDRPVAIKVLRNPLHAAGDQACAEARRLARLRHPGIVGVHDVGIQDGQVYIVSDFLDGPDLDRWLRDNRPSWPEAARIAAAVADALAHAHARLVVHRDVKPANILLTAERAPVLVDFGVALDEAQAGGSEKGRVAGTPWYMSPEQLAGSAHRIDGRTDIYSLGVVLYEMLTGRVPFRAVDYVELSRQVRNDEPQPPRQLVRDIPPELERICLKALAKQQQDRYSTAADLAEELGKVMHVAPDDLHVRVTPRTGVHAAARTSTGEPADALPTGHRQGVPTPSSQRRAREAERRQVTVLVCGCGLFVSEAYVELDAEDQAAVLRDFQAACAEAVHRHDGTIVQCSEQGLLVCFGYPVAYEDGARRATRTALGLRDALTGLGERLRRDFKKKLQLDPWIGLHTGPAVVEAKEDTVALVGEARNVALRLEDVATPGTVLCSEATHRLIRGHFDCANLGPRKLRGIAQPIALFEVRGATEGKSPVEATAPAVLSPLTGRDHEISLLRDRWDKAQEGMGQIVLLIGEPGLGKSRLVHTLKDHVQRQRIEGEGDATVIEWRCAPHYQNTGLHPAIDFYERALGFGRDDPPHVRFDRLLHRLEQYGLARPDAVPLWAALLSLPAPDRYPRLELSPNRLRDETFRIVLEWLHTRAARGPILFVVEDLHWVDASTLDFLRQFLAEGLHDSILTVLTFRPEFQTPWPALAHQTSLALTPLTRRQVGDLMRKKAGAGVSESLVEQIYARAGGVPLFVEEYTQMVQESGALRQEGGTTAATMPAREIPSTLQDLVMARLDRMENERELAQLAAALGREFGHELIAAVAGLDEATLQAQLARLVRAEILYRKGRPPRGGYYFKHALLEDAAYNSMIKSKRQQFHRRIAEVLEGRFPQTVETEPELLAHHCTESGAHAKAIDYWLKAGLRSRERSAESEAIGHLTRGMALLETLPESAGRDAVEMQILGPLANAYIAARGYGAPEVGPVLRRARQLCERIGQYPQLLAIIVGMWEWSFVRGDFQTCSGLVDEAADCAGRLNDRGGMMEAIYTAGQMKLYRGEFAGARDTFTRALTEFDDRERIGAWTAMTGHDAGLASRCNLAVSLWHLGFPEQALTVNQDARRIARELGHPFSVAYALHHTAWLYQYCRLGAELQTAAEEQMAISAEQGFALWHATGTFLRGAGMLLQGRLAEALPLMRNGHDAFRTTGGELHRPFQLCVLGDAFRQERQFAEAHAAIDEGLALAQRTGDRMQEAELLRVRGELHIAEFPDQATVAEDCYRQAIDTARRQQSRAWELRATVSLARLWEHQGRRTEARAAVATVFETYTEGFATPDLVDAAALLQSLV
jgi:class 3 adenylate cyclase/predicted ATPase